MACLALVKDMTERLCFDLLWLIESVESASIMFQFAVDYFCRLSLLVLRLL